LPSLTLDFCWLIHISRIGLRSIPAATLFPLSAVAMEPSTYST
jgi:hypothetical protein